MTRYDTTAKRFPRLPRREDVPEDERADYDFMVDKWIPMFQQSADLVDGKPWGVQHFEAFTVAPPVAMAILELGQNAVINQEGKPGTISNADHQLIDHVLDFDSGYWPLIGGHTKGALAAGVRVEAIEALAEGREKDLTDDERQQVEFIRAVRDGTMTDDIWERMVKRLGTERGAVDYVALILLLVFHHRFVWALGLPDIRHEDWRQVLEDFKAGRRDPHEPHFGGREVVKVPGRCWHSQAGEQGGTSA